MQSDPNTNESTPSQDPVAAEPVTASVELEIHSVEIGLESTINSEGSDNG